MNIAFGFVHSNGSECSKTSPDCPNDDEHCVAQSLKVAFPDVNTLFLTDTIRTRSRYNCKSADYCKFAHMWDTECIRIYKELTLSTAWEFQGSCLILDDVPVTLNNTLSCCQDSFDCNDIFNAINESETESIYSTTNCPFDQEITDVVADIAGCYATPEFMTYIQCNKTQYEDQCPPFFFYNLQTYA